jgi:hypothetical protein
VWHEQLTAPVKANPADAIQSVKNHAAVPAREATEFAVFEPLVQFTFGGEALENGFQSFQT